MKLNRVNLIGRLTKDCEVRKSESGTLVARFTLAINRVGTEETDFIGCKAFNKTAEVLEKYTSKGSQIGLEGSIQVSNFEDKDGNKRVNYEVIASRIELLGSKKDNNEEHTESKPKTTPAKDVFEEFGDELAISDEDLPF